MNLLPAVRHLVISSDCEHPDVSIDTVILQINDWWAQAELQFSLIQVANIAAPDILDQPQQD